MTENLTISKLLWSKVRLLLQEAPASDERFHNADDFAAFFRGKIEKIRQSTFNTPEAVTEWRHTPILDVLRQVTPAEIAKIIAEFPVKHCSLDPTPTWLVKRLSSSLAQTTANMCTASFM